VNQVIVRAFRSASVEPFMSFPMDQPTASDRCNFTEGIELGQAIQLVGIRRLSGEWAAHRSGEERARNPLATCRGYALRE